MLIKGDDFQEKIKAENYKKFMNIISNDIVLKELIGHNLNNIDDNFNNKQKFIEKKSFAEEKNKKLRFAQNANLTFFSQIPECLKEYQNFHGCGISPLNNVICLIAGICLLINSKKNINFY
jgi:hypothetical protein